MSEFSISHRDFNDGEEIPKKFGYKHGNEIPDHIHWSGVGYDIQCISLIMDDPDAMLQLEKFGFIGYFTTMTQIHLPQYLERMILAKLVMADLLRQTNVTRMSLKHMHLM